MSTGALSSALSGIKAAHQRVNVASHNLANLLTEDFHPLSTRQVTQVEGGVRVEVDRATEPQPVSIADELVGAGLAAIQAKASARVIEVELDVLGSLIDLEV